MTFIKAALVGNSESHLYLGSFQPVAFGIGLERATMLKYGINNIKLLFESDVKVLEQIDNN